jgi:Ca2+/H+ antiporter, TMEM165/GDT1 family
MFTAALISLGVVFVAELGDKSQLMTMTYALRHRWWVVLSGVAIAAVLVHGLSVTVGHFLGLTVSERPIAFAAAIAFFGFAVWTWRDRRDEADEASAPAAPGYRFALMAIISSYVLAELGDKTMLATMALASDRDWVGVWIGAAFAMVLADGLAIPVGALLHRRLPKRLVHGVAGALFLLFGLWLLFDEALGWRWVAVVATSSVAVVAAVAAIAVPLRGRACSK